MTATPGYVCDSMVRTSLTAEEIVYSENVVIRDAMSLYCGSTWAPARFRAGRTSVDVGTAGARSVRGMTDAIRRSARRRRMSAGATLHIVRDRAGGRMYGDAAGA